MPRVPDQYRGLSPMGRIMRWLRHGGNLQCGNLHLIDYRHGKILGAETYGHLFTVAEPASRVAHVLFDLPMRSHTSTTHRNRMLDALERQGYHITELPTLRDIIEIRDSLVSGNSFNSLADIEEIDESSLPPLPPPQATEETAPRQRSRRTRRAEPINSWLDPGGQTIAYSNNPTWTFRLAPDTSGSVTPEMLYTLIDALDRQIRDNQVQIGVDVAYDDVGNQGNPDSDEDEST